MSEHAFFEYRAKLMSTPYIEEQGEPIYCSPDNCKTFGKLTPAHFLLPLTISAL